MQITLRTFSFINSTKQYNAAANIIKITQSWNVLHFKRHRVSKVGRRYLDFRESAQASRWPRSCDTAFEHTMHAL